MRILAENTGPGTSEGACVAPSGNEDGLGREKALVREQQSCRVCDLPTEMPGSLHEGPRVGPGGPLAQEGDTGQRPGG